MDDGISEAEIERLLAHSDWLSALARRLVRDPAAADDVVQDTWQAALRSRPAARGSERGWLATLAMNFARMRSRSEAARRGRERSAARGEAIEGPDALVERAESQRALLGHVLALDEPYRGTLLARYVEGRTPAEIARRGGVNESTVRTRLARALEKLRTRLERERRGDPLLGLGALVGSMGVGNGALATASVATGALIMGTGTKLVLAGIAALGVWLAWWRLAPDSQRELEVARAASESGPAALPVEPVAEERSQRDALEQPARVELPKEATPAQPSLPPRPIVGLDVLFTRDGGPLPGVAVWLVQEASAGWRVPGRSAAMVVDLLDLAYVWPADSPRATSGLNGIASFPDLQKSRWFVGFDTSASASHPSRLCSGSIFSGFRKEIPLGTAVIRGRVFDEHGRPRAGVGVMVSSQQPEGRTETRISAMARTDARGEYRIGELWATDFRKYRTGYDVVMDPDGRFDGGEAQRKVAELHPGEEVEVDFGSETPGPRWSGRLLNAFDEPFPGTPRLELSGATDANRITAPVDAEGKFRLAFTPGNWRVRAFAAGCDYAGFYLGEVELGETDLVRDLIVPGTRLRGRVRAPNAREELPKGLQLIFRPQDHDYPAAFRDAQLREDGSYRIDGLEPGTWVASFYPGNVGSPAEIIVLEGVRVIDQDLSWVAK